MLKYADDTYLIVPSVNSYLIHSEIQHIGLWAESNNLKLNVSKAVEIIFTSPQGIETPLSPPIPTITRLDRLTVLGVVLSSTFKFTEHVEFLLSKVSKTMFALRTLRAHGMAVVGYILHDVTKATLISQLTYASPAWSGFISKTDNNSLGYSLKRFGYLPSSFFIILVNFVQMLMKTCSSLCVITHIMSCTHSYPQSKSPVITSDPDLIILPFPTTSLPLEVKIS